MGLQWILVTGIAALVFVASAVWLLAGLLGDGVSAGSLVGLALGLVGLFLGRLQWLQSRGVFYAEYEDEDTDEQPAARPAPGAPPVTRGWGDAPDTDTATGGGSVPTPDWLKEDEFKDVWDGPFEPTPIPPAAPQPLSPEDFGKLLEDLDRVEEAHPPRMEPERAAPDEADEAAPDEQAAEEVTPPESEPIPAAVGGEPAEKVLFSAFYPREVKPGDWQPFRAYMYKDFAAEAVKADARAEFDARTDIRVAAREATQPVPEDALVTALPSVPGFEFDPPQHTLRFRGDWRRFAFEFRAHDAPLDIGVDGHITFLVEGVVVADVTISVYVSETAGETAFVPRESQADPYQAIFCSYSHKDTAIVERVERASRYFNFRYLRDVTTLRSGERWNARLLELIDDADIFQLFWSKHAAESEYVRQEYQYALALRQKGVKGPVFIRPIRWEEPMPVPPPPELAELHFDLIPELAQID